jgi:hypothetical protein
MEIKVLIVIMFFFPLFFMVFVLPKIKSLREWRIERIRKSALKYIDLLDRAMKDSKYTRQQRRQFWRQFVSEGRFINE